VSVAVAGVVMVMMLVAVAGVVVVLGSVERIVVVEKIIFETAIVW
jgi:hypothetical protein